MRILALVYSPQRLSWGVGYGSSLDVDTEGGLVRILDFAMNAVHVLSCFPAWVDDRISPRLALAGLILIVCESARMNPIYNFFTTLWQVTQDLMRDYVLNKYGRMSHQLLAWKSRRYANPHPISPLRDIYLVLNYRLDPPHQAGGAESSSSFMDLSWSRHRKADGAKDRPRVELLAMHADLGVLGTTIIVFDGKRGHIIYRKQEQGEKVHVLDHVY